eukprot:1158635-Pelagomonas_calceolata.AAC.3
MEEHAGRARDADISINVPMSTYLKCPESHLWYPYAPRHLKKERKGKERKGKERKELTMQAPICLRIEEQGTPIMCFRANSLRGPHTRPEPVDWYAVLTAPIEQIQNAIQCRGFQFMLSKRIQKNDYVSKGEEWRGLGDAIQAHTVTASFPCLRGFRS